MMRLRSLLLCLFAVSFVAPLDALAEPKKGTVSTTTTEWPVAQAEKYAPQASTYGLCNAPQNADDFPSNPVPVDEGKCENSQTFIATSIKPSTGSSTCGGFTLAFGPKGDYKPYLDRVTLRAYWGDTPLTAANCTKARVAAVAWGARCTNDSCTEATWEKIGDGPKQRAGFWNTTSQVCYTELVLNSSSKKFKTLNIDVIAKIVEDGKWVRKRAKASIYAWRPNGKCPSATYKPQEKTKP
jgi:hypothetical protein